MFAAFRLGFVLVTLGPPLEPTAEEVQAFLQAIEANDLPQVAAMLNRLPQLVEVENEEDGRKAIHVAAWHGHREIGLLLLRHGAVLDLFVACGLGMTQKVAQLLDTDRNLPNTPLARWFMPLHLPPRTDTERWSSRSWLRAP